MKNNVFLVQIQKGQLSFGSEANQARWRQFLKDNDEKWLRIEKPISKRSGQQNRYMWMYFELIERETGNTTKDIHEYVVRHLTPKVERRIRLLKEGKWIEHVGMAGKGTSDLNKIEMGEVLDKLSALTDVPLPDPHMLDNFIPNY